MKEYMKTLVFILSSHIQFSICHVEIYIQFISYARGSMIKYCYGSQSVHMRILSRVRLCNCTDCSPSGSSVH